jgi:thiamine pyrophosphate-dependent acetolactate synthase large subunit-like protein
MPVSNIFFQRVVKVAEDAPRPYTSTQKIDEIYQNLKIAKRPLIVVGKGAAYSQAEKELLKLVNRTKIPFLPTPMGKGVIDDDHELCVNAARSTYVYFEITHLTQCRFLIVSSQKCSKRRRFHCSIGRSPQLDASFRQAASFRAERQNRSS